MGILKRAARTIIRIIIGSSETFAKAEPPQSNLLIHAERELRLAGFFDEDSDYSGMLAHAVMRLVKTHALEHHSGASHSIALSLFNKLVNFETLSPVTSDPEEWHDVSDFCKNRPMWQSRRNSALFSHDGGLTYYSINDPKKEVHKSHER